MLLAALRPRADSVVWDGGRRQPEPWPEIRTVECLPHGSHPGAGTAEAIDLLAAQPSALCESRNLHIPGRPGPDDLHLLPPIRIGCCWRVGRPPFGRAPCCLWRAFSLAAGSWISNGHLEGWWMPPTRWVSFEALDCAGGSGPRSRKASRRRQPGRGWRCEAPVS